MMAGTASDLPTDDPLEDLLGRSDAAQRPVNVEGGPVAAASPRDALYRRALALVDIVSAAVALLLAIVVLGGDHITLALAAAIPMVVVVGKVVGLYDRDAHLVRKTTLEEAPALFQVATLFTLLIWLGEGVLVKETTELAAGDNLGRLQVLGLWGLLFVSMLASRTAAREIVRRITPPERCIILGGPAVAERIHRKLQGARSLNVTVVGMVALESGDGDPKDLPVLGELDGLGGILRAEKIDRVIIAPSRSDTDQLLGAIRLVKSLGAKVSVHPRMFEVVGSSVHFDDVEGLMLLGVPDPGLTKSSRFVKRGVDLVASVVGIIVLAPLLAAAAVVVRLSSPGPAVFRQTRIGREGREFEMLKFRTMHDRADELKADLLDLNEAEGLFKIADDPRLTPIGRVLRRFSLDELPQLVNVLRGQMSLVGPRPLVTDEHRLVEDSHRSRLDLRPGMTGIWQVLGSIRVPLNEMVKIDYLYGANWSIWLDLKILLRTVPHVLGRRGM
jgi:exopolysaccharide biosynthesis polyprenyl glycosylphosphotransferase